MPPASEVHSITNMAVIDCSLNSAPMNEPRTAARAAEASALQPSSGRSAASTLLAESFTIAPLLKTHNLLESDEVVDASDTPLHAVCLRRQS